VASARAVHTARRGGEYGFSAGEVRVDMKAVKVRKDGVVKQSSDRVTDWVKGMKNVTLIRGHARFTAPRTLDVDVLRYGDRRYRDEFWESAYQKWTAGGSEEQALEAFLDAHPRERKWTFRTHLLPRDYDIFGSGPSRTMDRRASEIRSASCSASRSDEEKAKHL